MGTEQMQLIAATGNRHKLVEFTRMLEPHGFVVFSQAQAGVQLEVEETGKTFAENAYLKAYAIFEATGKAAVADDSGLCIDALGGEPGVYSARYLGENTPYEIKNQKILQRLSGLPEGERTARFVSAICCILADGSVYEATGVCEGTIGSEARGENGFGYDPIFYVGNQSFAELSGAEKDALSHRGRALRELEQKLAAR